jgi:chloramphenicol O-acetyltransferase
MYRCPDGFDDGLPTDYRSNTLDIGESLKKISDEGRRFDIALVDSWHEYETSWRDLVEGFRLIRQGGTLVVHDCLPPRSEIAVPNYIQGEWCGVSYQAYVDFISERHDLAVYTVDTDHGCGVIRKLADHLLRARRLPALSFSKTGAASATTHGSLRLLSGAQAGSAELDHHR